MRLSVLAAETAAAGVAVVRAGADADPEVSGVVQRSDAVTTGAAFCCVVGSRVDGHDLAADAIARGAVALLVERELPLDVPQLVVPSVRHAMGQVAAAYWGDPSASVPIVGVTGTNGKTTTVAMLRGIFERAGRRCAVLGTLDPLTASGPATTPDAPELQAWLAAQRDAGADVVAMEVSSHALALGRVEGTRFAVAVFTTLGHDHLDLHGDIESYFEAKASLFTPERTDRAVVRLDDPWGARLAARLVDTVVQVRGYAVDDTPVAVDATGSHFAVEGELVDLPLPGRYNVANARAAAAAAAWLGVDAPTIAAALSGLASVPGRFESVDAGQSWSLAVDYAHTPDALASVLAAARERAGATGRVLVVFGCGGDKDRAKRPEMGRIAAEGADVVVVTSDNPRSEDPAAIVAEIVAGVPVEHRDPSRLRVELDRRTAIHHAAREARDDDVVVIAGKGHETTQTFADRVVDFDDRVVAAEAVAEVLAR